MVGSTQKQEMSASTITDVYREQQYDPGESEVDRLFSNFGAALAQLAREKSEMALSQLGASRPLSIENSTVLHVVAGHGILESLGTALRYAPQGPLTPELYATIVKHQGLFSQTANEMFPKDPIQEAQLAELVRVLRASLHPTPRR